MIEPLYEGTPPVGAIRRPTDAHRIISQITRGTVRVGPDAAREIARRIEAQHGFWDLRQRRARKTKEA